MFQHILIFYMNLPHRKYIRWNGYDYKTANHYFITVVTHNRQNRLGLIVNQQAVLSEVGNMVWDCIATLHQHFHDIEIEDAVIMPNHVHFIITNMGDAYIPEVVRRFKAITSYQYHRIKRINDTKPLWQRNYYDRVIRDEREYMFVRNYIMMNPERWELDMLNDNSTCTEKDNIAQMLHQIETCRDFNPKDYFAPVKM